MNLDPKSALLAALAVVMLFYIYTVGTAWARGRGRADGTTGGSVAPTTKGVLIGFVTNFFDTLGIGSFAPTTTLFKFLKMVPDEKIPGTLNVGHTLPTIVQAFIFTKLVEVDSTTLIAMIGASVLGAWLGAGVVSRWPRRAVQLGMGWCLVAAALLMVASLLGLKAGGGVALGVVGTKLAIAVGANAILGALMTLGIGLYAPCLILVSLLGMKATAAFPIMMGSCAFLMPAATARFVRTGSFDLKASLGLMIGGVPAVLIAAYIVKSLPLDAVRVLVVIVVLYTAWTMIRSAMRESADGRMAAPALESES